ncbi:hypothetical protein L6164_026982 [Bauhinia variegata]|uniref:Uncharacterized protein n=1 Tax=Bauhinia variegata TaxID=167791 RepID=A0ACB9LS55_BAUVA|nr:hypothetical protein L6164_026982 [Bauhinia variegata]
MSATGTEKSNAGPHILVLPYPAQGHMLAMLDLTHQLVLKGSSITIVVTPKNLPILDSLLSTHPTTIQTLVLPFPSHPKLPPGVENVREIGNKGNYPIINALSKLQDPIIHWFKSHPSPPVALVSDFFLGWTLQLAHQLGIPRIVFYSSGAFYTAVINHCWLNSEAVRGSKLVQFSGLPGSPSFKEEHLPSIFRLYRESDPDSAFVKDSMLGNIESWGIVFNSFSALEGPFLDYLKTTSGHTRVFGVGPLSLIGVNNGLGRVNPDLEPSSKVFTWLDECPDGSVLYVCFGSQKFLKREQMEALAAGLEQSETRFIWVVNAGKDTAQVEDGFLDGFENRVGGRGLVIKCWAPQVSILNHQAVGGFLSHCGWNSVLEGTVSGVMFLTWPMEADQFVNAKLVENMGAAVRVCEGADSVPDPDELGRVIRELMRGDSAQEVRAKEFSDEAIKAVSDEGSSTKYLDELVKALSQI